jgi:hypothetical protein
MMFQSRKLAIFSMILASSQVWALSECASRNLFPLRAGEAKFLLVDDRRIVISLQTKNIVTAGTDSVFVWTQEGFSLVGRDRQPISKLRFRDVDEFSEGLAAVQVGDLWGYIDEDGKVVIPPRFGRARRFNSGLAAVYDRKNWIYIDKIGNRAFDIQIEGWNGYLADFYEGRAALQVARSGFLYYGYLDTGGRLAIPPIYEQAERFSEKKASVKREGKWGIITSDGEWILTPTYRQIGEFSNGLAPFASNDARWGYLDANGKVAINASFDAADEFCSGLAAVRIGTSWGYIDLLGKTVIEPAFRDARPFLGKFAIVTVPQGPLYGKEILIDAIGHVIAESPVSRFIAEF